MVQLGCITDIANAVQIQRGLGSSKLTISSVGGTVNIVTKATERPEGGFARFLVGNGSYLKGTVSYDTGLSDSGWVFFSWLTIGKHIANMPMEPKGKDKTISSLLGRNSAIITLTF